MKSKGDILSKISGVEGMDLTFVKGRERTILYNYVKIANSIWL